MPLNSELTETKSSHSFDNGELHVQKWTLGELQLGHSRTEYLSLGSFQAANDEDAVRMHFGMKGDYSFSYGQLNASYDLKYRQHNIMYSKGIDLTVYNKDLVIETFGVGMPLSMFLDYTQQAGEPLASFAEKIASGQNAILSEQWAYDTPAIQRVIGDVMNCRYTGHLKKLYFLSKSIELLVLQAETYDTPGSTNKSFIKTRQDREKIYEAREFAGKHLLSPPSLSEIAHEVGVNEYKLKRGFRELFQTTVFGYIADLRLEHTYKLLRDTDKSAAEIAEETGYSSPQHFNTAFKKKFGFTPHSVRG